MRRFVSLFLLLSLVLVLFVSCQPFDRIGDRSKDHHKEAPVVEPITPKSAPPVKMEPREPVREPVKNSAPAPDVHKDNSAPHRR